MTLKDFDFREDNHFVAMEYYALILNRTFLVLITKDGLIGLKANGMVSAEGGEDIFTMKASRRFAIRGIPEDPYSYLQAKYLKPMENIDLSDPRILSEHKENFIVHKSDIRNVFHDPRKKWGMGYYPHDGKVYVETISNKKREFIILGNQSGQRIVKLIIGR